MPAQSCISPVLKILQMAFVALPLLIAHTQARIVDWDEHGSNELVDELPFSNANSPFLAKIYGSQVNMMAKTRRRRKGVYDECCSKGCTYDEILSFCHRREELI